MNARDEIELVLHLLRSLIDRTHNMGTGIEFEHSRWLDYEITQIETDMKRVRDFYDEQTKKDK